MSSEVEVLKNVKVIIDAIKNTVMQNIVYAVNNKHITIEQSKLPGLNQIITDSIDQAFVNSAKGLNEALRKFTKKE